MLDEELAGLAAEPLEVLDRHQIGELDADPLADLVLEVGVDDLALVLLDEGDETPEAAADRLEWGATGRTAARQGR